MRDVQAISTARVAQLCISPVHAALESLQQRLWPTGSLSAANTGTQEKLRLWSQACRQGWGQRQVASEGKQVSKQRQEGQQGLRTKASGAATAGVAKLSVVSADLRKLKIGLACRRGCGQRQEANGKKPSASSAEKPAQLD